MNRPLKGEEGSVTIIASNEGISIFIFQLTIHILLSLLHCYVHVPIQTC